VRGLDGKIVIVTGGGGGIGRSLCRRFLAEGALTIACDINQTALSEVEQDPGAGGTLETVMLDITDYAAVAAAVSSIHRRHGRIDVLVNNAGWDAAMQFVDTDPEFWEKVIAINLYGPLNLQHCIVPLMTADGGGKIVNIASDAGRVGSSGEAVYSACKGGIIAFSKTLAREVARANIRVNTVCPGPTETPLLDSFLGEGDYGKKIYEGLKRSIPLRRLAQPEDLPGIVAFLASADADFITGQTISVSGGLTMHG